LLGETEAPDVVVRALEELERGAIRSEPEQALADAVALAATSPLVDSSRPTAAPWFTNIPEADCAVQKQSLP
jgi:hypothetical protein